MNKPHKHKNVIIAWANGAEIEHRRADQTSWFYSGPDPQWREDVEYRVKPEPKPDVVRYFWVEQRVALNENNVTNNLKLTFDGETGELWDAKVLK